VNGEKQAFGGVSSMSAKLPELHLDYVFWRTIPGCVLCCSCLCTLCEICLII